MTHCVVVAARSARCQTVGSTISLSLSLSYMYCDVRLGTVGWAGSVHGDTLVRARVRSGLDCMGRAVARAVHVRAEQATTIVVA